MAHVILLCESLTGRRPRDVSTANFATVNLIRNIGDFHYIRWEDKRVAPEGSDHIRNLTAQDSLYVIGHGSTWTIEGLSEINLARGLVTLCGLQSVACIYLTACYAGGKRHEVENEQSFAKLFHLLLGKNFGVRTDVIAWNGEVNVHENGTICVLKSGRKQTKFYWSGAQQLNVSVPGVKIDSFD